MADATMTHEECALHTCESMSCENLSMEEMSIGLTYKTNQRDWDKSVFDPQDLITDQR